MEQELEPSAAAGLDTDMSSEAAPDASDTQAGHEDQAPAEQAGANWYALEIARLKRSIGAAKTLIAGLKAAKKLIVKLAPVFAQDAKQVEIGSKAASVREKLLALADAACLPEHPIRRGFDAVLGQPDEMDTAVNAHALPIRNHVLEPFEALLNSVLHPDQADAASADSETSETSEASEATEESGAPPAKIDAAEFLETLDIRLKEWGLVRKQLAADLRKLRIKRLLSGRTLAIAGALLLIGGAATGAYFLTRPGPSKPAAAAAQGAVKQGAEQRATAVTPPQPAAPAAPATPAVSPTTPQAAPAEPAAVPVGAVAIAPAPPSPPASATASAASAAASMASASASASASAIAAQPSAADKTASASASAEPVAKAPPPPPPTPEAYKRSGLTTVVNGKDKAAIKQNVQQLGEVIKIWNEQIEQAAKDGKK